MNHLREASKEFILRTRKLIYNYEKSIGQKPQAILLGPDEILLLWKWVDEECFLRNLDTRIPTNIDGIPIRLSTASGIALEYPINYAHRLRDTKDLEQGADK